MKRVLVCSLAVMILMASCFTAFAAGAPSYVTTTKYVTDGDAVALEVDTAVTGAAKDTMLTYIAYNDANSDSTIADGEIVYLDQQTVGETGTLNFKYVTSKDNLTGVTVKFGTSDAEVGTTTGDITARKVTVVIGEDREVIYMPTTADTTVYPTDLEIPFGTEIDSVTCGAADLTNAGVVIVDESTNIVSIKDNNFADDAVINIAVSDSIEDPIIIDTRANTLRKVVNGTDAEMLTVFGRAFTDIEISGETGSQTDAEWGGIQICESEGFDANVETYRAYHRNYKGSFAVQLVNTSGVFELTNKTLYARAYVLNSKGVRVYSDVFELTSLDDVVAE